MKFQLTPILDKIEDLYNLPRNEKRFKEYLFMLQGNSKDDLKLPIDGYNPMAQESVLLKIKELKTLNAEAIIEKELTKINSKISGAQNRTIKVVVNLADDIGGAWSNFHTTDYSSKFDINALVKRNFCAPYFWTSEQFSQELIAQRVREYAYRTFYQINYGEPKTLQNRFKQEVFVLKNTSEGNLKKALKSYSKIEKFYFENQNSEDYNLNFCFFYGDDAAERLGYPIFGIEKFEGFQYARFLSQTT